MAEKIFTINLRKLALRESKWKKSKKSVALVRNFLKRHMKTDDIKLDKSITEEIWKRGSHKPPTKIRIKAYETEGGEKDEKKKFVKAELLGVVREEVKEKKEESKSVKDLFAYLNIITPIGEIRPNELYQQVCVNNPHCIYNVTGKQKAPDLDKIYKEKIVLDTVQQYR